MEADIIACDYAKSAGDFCTSVFVSSHEVDKSRWDWTSRDSPQALALSDFHWSPGRGARVTFSEPRVRTPSNSTARAAKSRNRTPRAWAPSARKASVSMLLAMPVAVLSWFTIPCAEPSYSLKECAGRWCSDGNPIGAWRRIPDW